MYDKPNPYLSDFFFFKFENALSLEDRAIAVSVCFFRGRCPTLKQIIEKEQSSCSDVFSLDYILVIVCG